MTEDKVKKAAQKVIDESLDEGSYYYVQKESFLALKASLTPSREEIANELERVFMVFSPKDKELADKFTTTINHAIAELRKGESK